MCYHQIPYIPKFAYICIYQYVSADQELTCTRKDSWAIWLLRTWVNCTRYLATISFSNHMKGNYLAGVQTENGSVQWYGQYRYITMSFRQELLHFVIFCCDLLCIEYIPRSMCMVCTFVCFFVVEELTGNFTNILQGYFTGTGAIIWLP